MTVVAVAAVAAAIVSPLWLAGRHVDSPRGGWCSVEKHGGRQDLADTPLAAAERFGADVTSAQVQQLTLTSALVGRPGTGIRYLVTSRTEAGQGPKWSVREVQRQTCAGAPLAGKGEFCKVRLLVDTNGESGVARTEDAVRDDDLVPGSVVASASYSPDIRSFAAISRRSGEPVLVRVSRFSDEEAADMESPGWLAVSTAELCIDGVPSAHP